MKKRQASQMKSCREFSSGPAHRCCGPEQATAVSPSSIYYWFWWHISHRTEWIMRAALAWHCARAGKTIDEDGDPRTRGWRPKGYLWDEAEAWHQVAGLWFANMAYHRLKEAMRTDWGDYLLPRTRKPLHSKGNKQEKKEKESEGAEHTYKLILNTWSNEELKQLRGKYLSGWKTAYWYRKRYLAPVLSREIQIKISRKLLAIKKKSTGKHEEKREPLCTSSRNVNWCNHHKN